MPSQTPAAPIHWLWLRMDLFITLLPILTALSSTIPFWIGVNDLSAQSEKWWWTNICRGQDSNIVTTDQWDVAAAVHFVGRFLEYTSIYMIKCSFSVLMDIVIQCWYNCGQHFQCNVDSCSRLFAREKKDKRKWHFFTFWIWKWGPLYGVSVFCLMKNTFSHTDIVFLFRSWLSLQCRI